MKKQHECPRVGFETRVDNKVNGGETRQNLKHPIIMRSIKSMWRSFLHLWITAIHVSLFPRSSSTTKYLNLPRIVAYLGFEVFFRQYKAGNDITLHHTCIFWHILISSSRGFQESLESSGSCISTSPAESSPVSLGSARSMFLQIWPQYHYATSLVESYEPWYHLIHAKGT